MKIPRIFIPEKNQDEKLKEILKGETPGRNKRIENIEDLVCTPKGAIGGYYLNKSFEMIDKKDYSWVFGSRISKDFIIQAGKTSYVSLSHLGADIYLIEFEKSTDLKEIGKVLEERSHQENSTIIRCLKKDCYLVMIKTSRYDKYASGVFEDWYVNNFGLEEL